MFCVGKNSQVHVKLHCQGNVEVSSYKSSILSCLAPWLPLSLGVFHQFLIIQVLFGCVLTTVQRERSGEQVGATEYSYGGAKH